MKQPPQAPGPMVGLALEVRCVPGGTLVYCRQDSVEPININCHYRDTNMDLPDKDTLATLILRQARELGADLVGLTNVRALKKEPSPQVVPFIPAGTYGSMENVYGLRPGEVRWPRGGRSVIVVALAHPEDRPELDWWYWLMDPPGNRTLKNIVQSLKEWLADNYGLESTHISYHIEKGGIFLKEAARLAGLGCIGRNNLLITPQFGPRVRLRALILNTELPSTGPSSFDPCLKCPAPCQKNCPSLAFDKIVLTKEMTGVSLLPGRDGRYHRENCAQIMQLNEDEAQLELAPEISAEPIPIIKYCRNCEVFCPVGSQAGAGAG